MLSVTDIASRDRSFIERNIRQNGGTVTGDDLTDRITLIRIYMVYLPPEEQLYVYSPDFVTAYTSTQGKMEVIKTLIVPSEYECKYLTKTMYFLYTYKRKQLNIIGAPIPDLYKIAQVLDVDIKYSPDMICQQIKEKAPDVEWQIQNSLDISKFDDDVKAYINKYIDYGFTSINQGLRGGWGTPLLNPYIQTLKELDKEIIVMRKVHKLKLPEKGIFRSLGYLSTSIAYGVYLLDHKDTKYTSVMRIVVPKGKKAIYVAGHEHELIFPHDIELEIVSNYKKNVFNNGEHYQINWYDVKML